MATATQYCATVWCTQSLVFYFTLCLSLVFNSHSNFSELAKNHDRTSQFAFLPDKIHCESLCPKFSFTGRLHLSSTFGAGMLVPNLDSIAATSQAESSHFCRKRMGYLPYSTPNDNVLNRMAVRTSHSGDMLSKESLPLIDIGLIATPTAFISYLLRHRNLHICVPPSDNHDDDVCIPHFGASIRLFSRDAAQVVPVGNKHSSHWVQR